MKRVIVDERIDRECERGLLERGFDIIKLPRSEELQTPVSGHPDMLLFVGKSRLVCHEGYYKMARDIIDRIADGGFQITLTDEKWSADYPNDVLFNAAPVGKRLICNERSVSKKLSEIYGRENIVGVKQGYAKCATVVVGDNGIITADPSIAKAAMAAGIDTLVLSGSYTRLDGYDTGFLGGASGDDGECVFFTGNIDLHPEADQMREFCKKQGREVCSLSKAPLYDYGSLIFI